MTKEYTPRNGNAWGRDPTELPNTIPPTGINVMRTDPQTGETVEAKVHRVDSNGAGTIINATQETQNDG